jgi:hypothetical protein
MSRLETLDETSLHCKPPMQQGLALLETGTRLAAWLAKGVFMKKQVIRTRLKLGSETIKQLGDRDLRDVAGGLRRSQLDDCPPPTYWCTESYPPYCYA